MQLSLIQARQFLIQQGVPETLLPMPQELRLRLEAEQARVNRQPLAVADNIQPAVHIEIEGQPEVQESE